MTKSIRENYPELLKNLNERPLKISNEANPVVNAKVLALYFDSLISLVKEYESNHPKNS
jgi:hypothetical protein